MNVLLIGSGGREHALAYKIHQSPLLSRLFIAPGNGGTGSLGENVALAVNNHAAVIEFCGAQKIDLVVIGPEAPLVAGLSDQLREAGFDVFGPNKGAAQLEGSKAFTKELCDEMNIPTAKYAHFETLEPALTYVKAQGTPIVIKADGLAAGKGVSVALNLGEAENALKNCFSGSFGAAGSSVIIEEFMEGEEVSFFAISDGEKFITLASAQDHKRAFDGDKGPNTGGMGAYSPAPVMTPDLIAKVEKEIIAPTISGLAQRGIPFHGVLYAGLILTKEGPKLIEYNARFGDPECQVLMMRLKSDLLEILLASARGDLSGIVARWHEDAALCVVLAANGYPESYETGQLIEGIERAENPGAKVFHAGTRYKNERLLSTGGRVLNITATGKTISEAQQRAYLAVKEIVWPEGYFRTDIGWRAIKEKQT
ncbi:MAG: phosphoribosylamine--glycine ligase [Devosiaceae bacterium]|nr:phosphoribosylamine--glycine ligase [Devosiaceae bacterium]